MKANDLIKQIIEGTDVSFVMEQIDQQSAKSSNADLAVALDEIFREFGSYDSRVHQIKAKLDRMPEGKNAPLATAANAVKKWCEDYKKQRRNDAEES